MGRKRRDGRNGAGSGLACRGRRWLLAGIMAAMLLGTVSGCGQQASGTGADAAQTAEGAAQASGGSRQNDSGQQASDGTGQNDSGQQASGGMGRNAQRLAAGGDAAQAFDELEIHFMDVGQGDATLIKCGDSAMLIDTGTDDKGTAIQSYLRKQGVEKLDYLILTHPDADHIGGAPVILTKFDIGQVFVSDFEKDNATCRKLVQALDDKRLKAQTPEPGSVFGLGTAICTVLGPNREYDTPNNASVALLIRNGENAFLFTGDAEEEAEQDILAAFPDIRADVYKAGHHGSKTASTEALLDTVQPKWAVISCETGNSYGHPHAQTLNNLRARGILVYRTDEQGSLIAVSDGRDITWNAAPSETWQAGEPTGGSALQTAVQDFGQPSKEAIGEAVGEAGLSNGGFRDTAYVLNTKTKKFHLLSCGSLPTANREDTSKSREEIIEEGYAPCKKCNP